MKENFAAQFVYLRSGKGDGMDRKTMDNWVVSLLAL